MSGSAAFVEGVQEDQKVVDPELTIGRQIGAEVARVEELEEGRE